MHGNSPTQGVALGWHRVAPLGLKSKKSATSKLASEAIVDNRSWLARQALIRLGVSSVGVTNHPGWAIPVGRTKNYWRSVTDDFTLRRQRSEKSHHEERGHW